MKKIVMALVLLIILVGCRNNSPAENTISKKEVINKKFSQPIKVVEEYNKAISSRDWDKAREYLDGQAKKTFEINVKKYKNSANLLSQNSLVETEGEKFCIIKTEIDFEILKEKDKKVLPRRWVRNYLKKSQNWKIVKIEELQTQYPQSLKSDDNTNENKIIKDTVNNFIKYSIEGNIENASIYLTGNLLNNAEKYKINHIPKAKLHKINVTIIGGTYKAKFVEADYTVDDRDLKVMFHLVKIKDSWLINNYIN